MRDVAGERIAIHRTYLAPDGSGKADVPKSRMMLGSVAGGAVRLGEIGTSGVVGLGEGLETCLSVTQACPTLPVWAALASGNLEQVALPPESTRVVILADNDGEGAGLRAAQRAAERFGAEGRRVWIAHPPDAGEDFNDLLLSEGRTQSARWSRAPPNGSRSRRRRTRRPRPSPDRHPPADRLPAAGPAAASDARRRRRPRPPH